MKTFWLVSFLGLLCICSSTHAQDIAPPVVIATALADTQYGPGPTVSDSIPVPVLADHFSASLDRTNYNDPSMPVMNFRLEQFVNGSWTLLAGTDGLRGGVTDLFGNPRTATTITSVPSVAPAAVRVVIENTDSVRKVTTNSAIQMWKGK